MAKFDKDIQQDIDDNNITALAYVAQDLRDTLRHVSSRAYIAAMKRKNKEQEEQSNE